MTNRGRFLIAISIVFACGSVLRGLDVASLASLSILVYVAASWCLFKLRTILLWPHLQCVRLINGRETKRSVTLWADRSATFEVVLKSGRGSLSPFVVISDWVPDLVQLASGTASYLVTAPTTEVKLKYTAKVLAAGTTCFPGVFVRFRDPAGLFLIERFFESPASVTCLPGYDARSTMQASVKRLNSLPQHGIHRVQRAGLGSELLELREYQSGDPPKSIAWKISARRGQLMTRQYESEVPVRVTLFVDGTGAARQGELSLRGIDHLNRMAASIASAAVRSGDQVGLVTFDEQSVSTLRPGYGQRAFLECQRRLAAFSLPTVSARNKAGLAEYKVSRADVQKLLELCRVRYPELVQSNVNLLPFAILPLFPQRRRIWQDRCRIAVVAAAVLRLDAVQCSQLCYDDAAFIWASSQLQFANGRIASIPPPMQPSPQPWAASLGRAINAAVSRARDNEVFVVLTDLLSRQAELEELLHYAKIAVARHHRVVFVCPRQRDSELLVPERFVSTTRRRYDAAAVTEAEILTRAARKRQLGGQRTIQRSVRRLGAQIAFADADSAAAMVMEQVRLAGSGRSAAGVPS